MVGVLRLAVLGEHEAAIHTACLAGPDHGPLGEELEEDVRGSERLESLHRGLVSVVGQVVAVVLLKRSAVGHGEDDPGAGTPEVCEKRERLVGIGEVLEPLEADDGLGRPGLGRAQELVGVHGGEREAVAIPVGGADGIHSRRVVVDAEHRLGLAEEDLASVAHTAREVDHRHARAQRSGELVAVNVLGGDQLVAGDGLEGQPLYDTHRTCLSLKSARISWWIRSRLGMPISRSIESARTL